MKPSTARVLEMLRTAGDTGVCGSQFLEARIARYGARVHELRHPHPDTSGGHHMNVAGYCPACGRESLMVALGQHITCGHLECPNPTLVDDILADSEIEHTVTLEDETFSILHPLRERRELRGCPLHRYLVMIDGPPAEPGNYRARLVDDRWVFEPLEEVAS